MNEAQQYLIVAAAAVVGAMVFWLILACLMTPVS